MLVTRDDTNILLEVVVDDNGPVSGLTVTAAIRDGTDSTNYLDFNDDTFKTVGWTSKTLALSDLSNGHYVNTYDMSGVTNLPSGKHLSVEYVVTGSVDGVARDTITFIDETTNIQSIVKFIQAEI